MEKKLYTGTVYKINSLEINSGAAEVQEDELNRVIIKIKKVSSQIVDNLKSNDNYNVVQIKLGADGFLSVFYAYIQQVTSGMQLNNGIPTSSISEIVLVSSSAIKGSKFLI